MTLSDAITATRGLLALVKASGGSIESRIRLQKEAYLLKWLRCPLFRPVRFKYHHYGPYSRYLSACLHNAVLDGLLTEHADDFGSGHMRYTYELGEHLDPEEHEASVLDPFYAAVVERLDAEEWRTLELSATVLFLEEEEKKDQHEATQRALALKPECEPYEEQARALLSYLKEARQAAPATPA